MVPVAWTWPPVLGARDREATGQTTSSVAARPVRARQYLVPGGEQRQPEGGTRRAPELVAAAEARAAT